MANSVSHELVNDSLVALWDFNSLLKIKWKYIVKNLNILYCKVICLICEISWGGGTIDSIVTDPPYELNFMWKGWDNSWIAFQPDTWKRCLEALKPWWYLLAFGGSRTYHRIACAIEDAGFEIRDCIMWLYGSWFPKSMNIWLAIDKKNWVESEVIWEWKSGWTSRAYQSEEQTTAGEYQIKKASNEWNWWGTALKPSYEPIIVARKPLEWSCTDNVIKYGVGGINIDECRVGNEVISIHNAPAWTFAGWEYDRGSDTDSYRDSVGRFPANTILTYDESDFEEVCWGFPNTKWTKTNSPLLDIRGNNYNNAKKNLDISYERWYNDEWSAARYFYCAKASKRDRDEGCTELEDWLLRRMRPDKDDSNPTGLNKEWRFAPVVRKNTHPTVKPCDLMQYLVRLVTPNGWTVLDPFNWSGSTWKAVMYENKDRNKNYKYIWIELTDEYLPIAKARIEYVINKGTEIEKSEPKEEAKQRKESALF